LSYSRILSTLTILTKKRQNLNQIWKGSRFFSKYKQHKSEKIKHNKQVSYNFLLNLLCPNSTIFNTLKTRYVLLIFLHPMVPKSILIDKSFLASNPQQGMLKKQHQTHFFSFISHSFLHFFSSFSTQFLSLFSSISPQFIHSIHLNPSSSPTHILFHTLFNKTE
jgi:hypothetical protein